MNSGKRNAARKIVCVVLAVLILGSLVSGALIMTVHAASSKEIEKELVELRDKQAELKKESDALQSSIKENQSKTQTLVQKKADIDQQMEMSRQTIENLNQQIQQYSLLIAQKQDELEQTEAEEDRLNQQYKTRLRAMEETGKISYWSILFGASSFSDLLDKIDMINEIAESDKLMLEKMADVAAQIASERADLETQMDDLEQAKADLAEQQAELETQRAESDQLILQMSAEYDSLSEEYQNYEKLEDEMSAQIKKTETEYFNALSKEEAARQAELNRQNNNKVPSSTGSSGGSSTGGFLYPLPYAVPITDAYGYRIHPLSGTYKWHNGVDLAAGSGTAIYATKSGTVTSACYNEAYGYMVTLDHADGVQTFYAHMTNYLVSTGETVRQGQIIARSGATGWVTGPHLHLDVQVNGEYVDPLEALG